MTGLRAVGYIRVSTEKQAAEEKVSLEEQKSDIESYCNSRGYEIVGWYADVGSGASKRRPQFQAMLKDVPQHNFDVIVAWKSDRLSRGMYPAAALMEALEGADIRVEAVRDSIDIKTFGIMAAVGKIELENIRERARMGRAGRAKQGFLSGQVKFGYVIGDDHRPAPHPEESAIVVRIFREYLKMRGCLGIARDLNQEGVFTRQGKQWNVNTVWSIIKDPVYIGQGYYGKRQFYQYDTGEKDVRRARKRPESDWIALEFPPIIDQDTWERAQSIRSHPSRQRSAPVHHVTYLLRGIIWCDHCGVRFTPSSSPTYATYTRKDGTRVRSKYPTTTSRRYICRKGKYYDKECPSRSMSAAPLEQKVWDALVEGLTNQEQIERAINTRREQLLSGEGMAQLEKHRKRVESLQQERSRVLQQHQKGYIDDGELDLKMRGIRDQLEYFQDESSRLESELAGLTAIIEHLEVYRDNAERNRERLRSMSPEEKSELCQKLLVKVTVARERIQVATILGLSGVLDPVSPRCVPTETPCIVTLSVPR